MPPELLAAAVLAAEGVSAVLVGSGALRLHGCDLPVRDVDLVVRADGATIGALTTALAAMRIDRHCGPPFDPRADVCTVETSFGTVDLLFERGRADYDGLDGRGSTFTLWGVPVRVAAADDAWALRRRFKDVDE